MRTLLAIVAIASIGAVASITIVSGLASPRTGVHNAARTGVHADAKSRRDGDTVGASIDAPRRVDPKTLDEAPSRGEELCHLSFLIGEWSSEAPTVEASAFYRWSLNHTCILGEYKIQRPGKPEVSAVQRFAFDAADHTVRQWVFFEDGGYGEAVWTPDGQEWIAKTWGATGGGEYTSATMRVIPKGENRLIWKVTDRIDGDQAVPDAEPITMVKKPMVAKQ